jgi:Uncharacterized protein conserved in bacteria (DUF2169)
MTGIAFSPVTPTAEALPLTHLGLPTEVRTPGQIAFQPALFGDRQNTPSRTFGGSSPSEGDGMHCVVAFGVGRWLKQILVTGDCTWKVGITRLGNTPTDPAPFSAMLVSFENAYGGRDPADATGLRATPGAGFDRTCRARRA